MDEILSELRAIREAYAQEFNYDVFAMWRDINEAYEKSGRRGVVLPAKPARFHKGKQKVPKLKEALPAE
ncbi:MAG: hypothetical protein ACLFRG_11220 [Desulfococcaceae bacterium]